MTGNCPVRNTTYACLKIWTTQNGASVILPCKTTPTKVPPPPKKKTRHPQTGQERLGWNFKASSRLQQQMGVAQNYTGGANRGFWSMFPLTRVPFLYRFFEPPPTQTAASFSPRQGELSLMLGAFPGAEMCLDSHPGKGVAEGCVSAEPNAPGVPTIAPCGFEQ